MVNNLKMSSCGPRSRARRFYVFQGGRFNVLPLICRLALHPLPPSAIYEECRYHGDKGKRTVKNEVLAPGCRTRLGLEEASHEPHAHGGHLQRHFSHPVQAVLKV